MPYRLTPIRGNSKIVPLQGQRVTIGRSPESTVPLLDEAASRAHCVLEQDSSGAYTLTDLESRNGTRVNEQKISKVILNPGDVIRIGGHEFLFENDPAAAAKAKPARSWFGGAKPSVAAEARIPEAPKPPARSVAPEPPAASAAETTAAMTAGAGGGSTMGSSIGEAEPSPALRPPPLTFDRDRGGAGGGHSSSTIDRSERMDTIGWLFELASIMDNLPPRNSLPETIQMINSAGVPSDTLAGASDGPNCVRVMLQLASKARATDIHFEPRHESFHIRMRVDGDMVQIVELPKRVGELAYGLIKSACSMTVQGRDAVQEGHFSAVFPDRRVEYRISFTPSVHGQKLVVRVLDMRHVPASLHELGFANYMIDRLKRVCEQDSGLLLVCGPTGSGKTTTIYNCLKMVDRTSRNVITIEDPVEYQLEGVTQIPVDDNKGNTFGQMLRSVLRQDPDVIFVGEVRDEETARTAMQAAMTGHVVFSSIHAKDTISATFRLLDLKVEPYLVANSLDLILAQRLVRVLCDQCKREVRVTPGQATRIGKWLGEKTLLYVATGCQRCLRTGYRGRRALFEMLEFNDELRDLVMHGPSIGGMRKIIDQGLFTTLTQFGWRLAAEGVTSLDEVDRVAAAAR